ncbi:hypothetical protein EB151_11845, partial [archaeon]|nr:hypothetical protein [archaeon]
CENETYGLYSAPSFHHNQDTSFLTSSAVKFNGTEYLETNEINLVGQNDFSISAWVKTDSAEDEYLITDLDQNSSGAFFIKANNENNRPEFSIYNGIEFVSVTGQELINDDNWHLLNVNFSCDKASSTSRIEIYIDSELQDFKEITGFIDLDQINTSGIWDEKKNELYKLFDKDKSSYIEMSNSQEESDFFFRNPIVDGIDKIRYRAINDDAVYGKVQTSLILRDKVSNEITTFEFQSFTSANFDHEKGVSNYSAINKTQTPTPPPIPESGITYGPVDSFFVQGCPHNCTNYDLSNQTWFPLQEYNITYNHENIFNRGFYPLRVSDQRDYETDSNGSVIENDPQYIYANFNTWQTDAPFLYGHDWDSPQFTDKEIIGLKYQYLPNSTENTTFGMDFSRIIEFGLYLNGEEYNLMETHPLNGFNGLASNHDETHNLTIGASSSDNKIKFFNGSIDQIIILDD